MLRAGVALSLVGRAGRGLAAAGRSGVPILAYHRLDPSVVGPTTITVKTFESQIAWLRAHDYRILPLRDALAMLPHLDEASRVAVITFDDGHLSTHEFLFPLVRKHVIPVTLFIYPSAISRASYALTWQQLEAMHGSGLVDVQSHTYWHPNFRVEQKRMSAARFRAFADDQLRRSRKVIESRLGNRVDSLAWPYGIVDPELEELARAAGYRFAFTFAGGRTGSRSDPLALPRIPIANADRGPRFDALLTGTVGRTL
jgi:peptidoglycan/xylan/chitin deacetylase (PgdA/CDA1 family)